MPKRGVCRRERGEGVVGAMTRLREVYDGRNRVAFRLTASLGDVGRGELTHAVQCASLIGTLQKRLHLTALHFSFEIAPHAFVLA